MLQKRIAKSKSGKSKDVLVAPDDSRALHWKNPRVKERENEDEEEIFSSSGLSWILIAEASGANENPYRRNKRRRSRRIGDQGSSSSMVEAEILEDVEEGVSGENLDEGGNDDSDDYAASSPVLDDDDVRYEDDED